MNPIIEFQHESGAPTVDRLVISPIVSGTSGHEHQVTEHRHTKENFMSAPSRRPEIRRRRTRAEKIAKLRKRLAAASASNDKDLLTAKLHRVGLVSPGNPLVKSA
jgi:hypothetical protein